MAGVQVCYFCTQAAAELRRLEDALARLHALVSPPAAVAPTTAVPAPGGAGVVAAAGAAAAGGSTRGLRAASPSKRPPSASPRSSIHTATTSTNGAPSPVAAPSLPLFYPTPRPRQPRAPRASAFPLCAPSVGAVAAASALQQYGLEKAAWLRDVALLRHAPSPAGSPAAATNTGLTSPAGFATAGFKPANSPSRHGPPSPFRRGTTPITATATTVTPADGGVRRVTSRCAAEEMATGASHWRVLLAVHCVYYRPVPRRGTRAVSSGSSSGGTATRGWQQHQSDAVEEVGEGEGVRALWGGAGAGCLVYTMGQAPAALAFATAPPSPPSPSPVIDHDEEEGEEDEEEGGFGDYAWPVRQCRVHSLVGTADDVRAYFATVPAATTAVTTAAGNGDGDGDGEEGRADEVEVDPGGAAPGDIVMTLLHSPSPAVAYRPLPTTTTTNGAPGAKEGSDHDPWAAETLRREARDGVLPPVTILGHAVLPLNQVGCLRLPFLGPLSSCPFLRGAMVLICYRPCPSLAVPLSNPHRVRST